MSRSLAFGLCSCAVFILVLVVAGSEETEATNQTQRQRIAIIGGNDAPFRRYPYYTRLDHDTNGFFCGGSLIHTDLILTAAHCVSQGQDDSVTVTVGAMALEGFGPIFPSITRQVKKILLHPTYGGDNFVNDFAIIKIDPISEDLFKPVAWNRDRDLLIEGLSLTAIGLGYTNNEDNLPATRLQEVELKVISDETCDKMFKGHVHRKSMICASDMGQDSCRGDSGGPLLLLGESDTGEDDLQVGIVSFGAQKCANPDTPGVYAQIDYAASWIDKTICLESNNPPEDCELLLESQTCKDSNGAFYVNWWHQFQRCEWLKGRLDRWCKASNEAWVRCPLTCHACLYELDDDILFDGDTVYDKSSSPVPFIFIIILIFIACYLFCCQGRFSIRNRLQNIS